MTTKSISNEDITIDVNHETYRTRMYKQAIFGKMHNILPKVVESLQLPETLISQSLWDFGSVSTRCTVVKGEFDFEFVQHNDTEDEITSKLMAFIDSKHISLLEDVVKSIITMDRAQDDELAPPSSDKKK